MPPPGWTPASNDAAAELAKQLVKLTEIIVELTTNHDASRELRTSPERAPARARSPDPDDRGPPTTPGVEARPETPDTAPVSWLAAVPDPEPEPEPEPDPRTAIVARLHELDRERQAVRSWMDADEASGPGWPSEAELARFRTDMPSNIPDSGAGPADGGPGGMDG
jgi:hypothetical protein